MAATGAGVGGTGAGGVVARCRSAADRSGKARRRFVSPLPPKPNGISARRAVRSVKKQAPVRGTQERKRPFEEAMSAARAFTIT